MVRLFRGVIVIAILMALGLSACGRKGSLEPPPGAPDKPVDRPLILDKILH